MITIEITKLSQIPYTDVFKADLLVTSSNKLYQDFDYFHGTFNGIVAVLGEKGLRYRRLSNSLCCQGECYCVNQNGA